MTKNYLKFYFYKGLKFLAAILDFVQNGGHRLVVKIGTKTF